MRLAGGVGKTWLELKNKQRRGKRETWQKTRNSSLEKKADKSKTEE